ncbi:MAG: hypothetical protein AAF485_29975, partial [Chloroflexota bacterium]
MTTLPKSSSHPVTWHGWALALFSITAFSLSPLIVKILLAQGVHPTLILALRFIGGASLLFLTVGIIAPDRLRIDRQGLRNCILAGTMLGLTILCFYWSLTR